MKKLTILIALVLLGACSPKKNSVKSNVSATIAGVPLGTACAAGSSQQKIGYIYDSSAQSSNFETRAKAMLSSYLQPSEVGSISGRQGDTTGIGFTGTVKLDANGAVVPAQTNVKITVYDSTWLYNQTADNLIEMNFNTAKGSIMSGQFNPTTGVGFLSLADSYGEIRFEGTIDAQKLSGNVTFANKTTVVGGTPASGALGQFWVNRCAFLQ